MYTEIANILKKTNNELCIAYATILETDGYQSSSLNFRNFSLSRNEIIAIAAIIYQDKDLSETLASISFSYNTLMGDEGSIALVNSLPLSIREIGLVGCGIGDAGGKEVLRTVEKLPNLQMLCIEQNLFSDQMQREYKEFRNGSPRVLVMF